MLTVLNTIKIFKGTKTETCLYYFSFDAVTHYCKFSGLKQQKFTVLQFMEVFWMVSELGLTGLKFTGLLKFLSEESRGESVFFCFLAFKKLPLSLLVIFFHLQSQWWPMKSFSHCHFDSSFSLFLTWGPLWSHWNY